MLMLHGAMGLHVSGRLDGPWGFRTGVALWLLLLRRDITCRHHLVTSHWTLLWWVRWGVVRRNDVGGTASAHPLTPHRNIVRTLLRHLLCAQEGLNGLLQTVEASFELVILGASNILFSIAIIKSVGGFGLVDDDTYTGSTMCHWHFACSPRRVHGPHGCALDASHYVMPKRE